MFLDQFVSLFSVIIADIFLAGDNAIIIGMVASTAAAEDRRRVIIIGIAMAAIMRIIFALLTVQLLQLPGVLLAGGVVLIWVAWKFWQNLRAGSRENKKISRDPNVSLQRAIFQIAIADLSMSLDNVLAVAGIARDHPWILIFGLALSIALMAVATPIVVKILERYPRIAYLGLGVILYIAATMIWHGAIDLMPFAIR
jgi:YjbE family integral membrane protein